MGKGTIHFGLVGLVLAASAACSASEPSSFLSRIKHNPNGASASHIVTRFGSFDPTDDGLPELLAGEGQKPAGTPTALWAMPYAGATSSPTYMVQFYNPVGQAERQVVLDAGAQVLGYMPENALVVRASATILDDLRHTPGVRAVTVRPTLLKVDPRLVRPRGASMTLDSPLTPQEAVVEVADADVLGAVHEALLAAGGERLDATDVPFGYGATSMHVRLGAEALLQLATHEEVAGISPKFERVLHNDRAVGIVQSGAVGRVKVWDAGLRGEGQVVAVADTGLHTGSCYFAKPNKIVAYQDWAGNHDGDADGHGTHVAGSIAGDNIDPGVFRRHDGMAPRARLLIQDVADGSQLVGLNRDLTPLLQAAYDGGAAIHSNSWGDDDNAYGPDARAIDRFVAQHRQFLVIVANGNAGARGHGSVGSPATAKNIIAVGAIDGADPERVAPFSSRGPSLDGRIKPTLVAPGVRVVSAMHRGKCRSESRSGTSMAAPILAGAAALTRQYFLTGYYPTGRKRPQDALEPTAALVRAVLLAGADSMRSQRDVEEALTERGYGRLHLDRVLRLGDGAHKLMVINEDYPLQTGETLTFTFNVAGGMPLDVALAWTDPPASPGAGWAQVNNLDLTLCKDGVRMHGNAALMGLDGSNAEPDDVNVEEVVHLPMAPGGRYTVTVSAPLVPMGPQPFGLVISGALDGGVQTRLSSQR
jgi:subtilisin family serine protease